MCLGMAIAYIAEVYDPVLYRLLTFPLVTIAAINGHGECLRRSHCMSALMGSIRGRDGVGTGM